MTITITTSLERAKRTIDSIREFNASLYLRLQMNSRKIVNTHMIDHISKIARELPKTEFLFDIPFVDEEIVADHLNGGLNGYDNSPIFALS